MFFSLLNVSYLVFNWVMNLDQCLALIYCQLLVIQSYIYSFVRSFKVQLLLISYIEEINFIRCLDISDKISVLFFSPDL